MRTPAVDRDVVLAILLLLVAALVWVKMTPASTEPVLRLDISKNRSMVRSLDQRRDVIATRQVLVDVMDLSRDGRLAHPRLGDIGYGQHFFVDMDKRFVVRQSGQYRLVVASDDGFSIRIDGTERCAFGTERSLTTQSCTFPLDEGEHELQLRYFQSGGPAGLKVQYGRQGESKLYWLGESGPHWRFGQED